MFVRVASAVLCCVLVTAAPVAAGIIYDNGGPNTSNGYSIEGTDWTADDFMFSSAGTIRSVGFYYQNYNGISGWDQNVSYSIIEDSSGPNGTVVGSGVGQNVVPTDSGMPWCCGGGNAYLVTFDLQSPVSVNGSTTYWLQLTGASTSQGNSWWVTSDPNSTSPGLTDYGSTGYQFSFYLSDTPSGGTVVPEPGSAVVVGLGGALIFFLRRQLRD